MSNLPEHDQQSVTCIEEWRSLVGRIRAGESTLQNSQKLLHVSKTLVIEAERNGLDSTPLATIVAIKDVNWGVFLAEHVTTEEWNAARDLCGALEALISVHAGKENKGRGGRPMAWASLLEMDVKFPNEADAEKVAKYRQQCWVELDEKNEERKKKQLASYTDDELIGRLRETRANAKRRTCKREN